jgi:hypothetical protein
LLPVMSLQPKKHTSLLRIFLPSMESYRRQLRQQGFDETSLSRVLAG